MECKLCNVNTNVWYRTTQDFGIIELEPNVITCFYKKHETPGSLATVNMEHALKQIADRELGTGNYSINRHPHGHYHLTARII
jgi:hypothetical protein